MSAGADIVVLDDFGREWLLARPDEPSQAPGGDVRLLVRPTLEGIGLIRPGLGVCARFSLGHWMVGTNLPARHRLSNGRSELLAAPLWLPEDPPRCIDAWGRAGALLGVSTVARPTREFVLGLAEAMVHRGLAVTVVDGRASPSASGAR